MPGSGERQEREALPRRIDPEAHDPHQIAFATMVAVLLCVVPAFFIVLFLATGQPERLLGAAPFWAVGVTGWALLRNGKVRLTCQILVFGVWASAVNALLWTHGLTGTSIGLLVLTLAFAGWLAGPVSALVLTAATPPVFFLLAYLEVTGWPIFVSANVTPYQRALLYSFTALGGGALGYFGAASLRERLNRLLGSERDLNARIAELQARDEALRRSEHKYATVFNTVPDAIAVTRRNDGTHLEVNPAWERLLGRPRELALGCTSTEMGVWADPAERAALISRLDRDGAVANFPIRLVHATGRVVDVLVSAVPYGLAGEPCIVWAGTDISELRASEQALAQSENRYRSLFQAASDCILVIDRDGRLLDINAKGSRTLGYSREELLGEAFTRVLDAHLMSRMYPRAAHILAERRSVRGEQELVSRSGSRHYVEFVANPLPDGNVLAIVRDVTERKQMEATVHELNASLERRVFERTAALEAAIHELESFSYSVSHDLRAPLRAIAGFSEILRVSHSAGLDEEAAGLLGRIENNAARMNTLIDDLLEFSRVGRKEVARHPVGMRSVVDSVLADLRETAPDGTVIEVGSLPAVWGDESLLREIWQNLIGNAIKYSRHARPPRIEIGSVAREGAVEYFVRDNGAGFDMAYADKLFGVFQRLHTEKEFEGTGVGLAIVRRVLARHGGRISAEGTPGQGATFRFTLPAGVPEDSASAPGIVAISEDPR